MRIRVVKVFGHEVLRFEQHTEATVSDVVRAMLAHRMEMQEEASEEETDTCEECGAEIEEVDEDDIIAARFHTMTERLVWDARSDEDYPEPPESES
jgi:hypothetical protein